MGEDPKSGKFDPVTLATWARLASAGASPIGGKPYGAEDSRATIKTKKKKKRRSK